MHPPGRNGSDPINSYALVTYLPDPLGAFVDGLRRELEPDAPHTRSHVTLLPPRPVTALEAARGHLRELLASVARIRVGAGGVIVFPVTSVICVSITAGNQELIRAHQLLNSGPLAQAEAFDYC
ncbi:MAG: 2'-5' RNA ligase family protein, partial [Bryobacteraceae bacterium]